MNLIEPQIIKLPKILHHRGNLTFIEELSHIQFEIQRSFWIYVCRVVKLVENIHLKLLRSLQ